jgi:3'-phosphoadenosine 5'-phosphosulfate (PAPS) 3'-phosphatase
MKSIPGREGWKILMTGLLWHHWRIMKKPPASSDATNSPAEAGDLESQKRAALLQRLRQRFAHVPVGVSLADELISERRADSGREG